MLLAEDLSERVIGLAITVHRHTGRGLLESVYEQCLCYELTQAGLPFERQVAVPVIYRGVQIGSLSVILCARHNRRQGGVSCRAKSGNWNAM